ncbi:unnamed protein product [Camellia sinensis]
MFSNSCHEIPDLVITSYDFSIHVLHDLHVHVLPVLHGWKPRSPDFTFRGVVAETTLI